MAFIRWFDEVGLDDRPTVGGKCAGLGDLISAGLDVPPGFAVTVDAWATLTGADGPGAGGPGAGGLGAGGLGAGGLGAELARLTAVDPTDPLALAAAHRRAATLIRAAPLPAGLREQVAGAYARLGERVGRYDVPVAVRSSAVAEDGDLASFAGQQETYLWTVGVDELESRLRDCWASLFTPQAIAYRSRLDAGQARDACRMGVGVQVMVDAEVAGVALTVSPLTGDRSLVGINASWGLGHAVVSGEVTPDEYWLSKVDLSEVSRVIARKASEFRPDPAGRGVVHLDVPPERRDVACLAPEQARLVAEMAVRVERHAGTPQDIEWAIADTPAGGRLLVLQARPETTWRARLKEQADRVTARAGDYLALVHAAGRGFGAVP